MKYELDKYLPLQQHTKRSWQDPQEPQGNEHATLLSASEMKITTLEYVKVIKEENVEKFS